MHVYMDDVHSAHCEVITDWYTDKHMEQGVANNKGQHFPPTDMSKREPGCEASLEEH